MAFLKLILLITIVSVFCGEELIPGTYFAQRTSFPIRMDCYSLDLQYYLYTDLRVFRYSETYYYRGLRYSIQGYLAENTTSRTYNVLDQNENATSLEANVIYSDPYLLVFNYRVNKTTNRGIFCLTPHKFPILHVHEWDTLEKICNSTENAKFYLQSQDGC